MASAEIAHKLRIYCETLPYAELTRARTIGLLRRHELESVLAVRPWQLTELPEVARTLEDAGVHVSVWPMLSDEEGRWASAQNAGAFVAFVRDVIDRLTASGARPREVLLDLEPPFAHARALAASAGGGGGARSMRDGCRIEVDRRRHEYGLERLAAAVAELHARGIATACAVWPLVALDAPGARGWQALLGTPVDALAIERVSAMVYTSILEGWSRGTIRRRDATALLSAASARVVRRWGDAAGMSLGCVGTGALVDEPVYRNSSELAEDVALARAAGVRDLLFFDLGGVFFPREPAEAWLDAFAHGSELFDVRTSRRVGLARKVARVVTWALRKKIEG